MFGYRVCLETLNIPFKNIKHVDVDVDVGIFLIDLILSKSSCQTDGLTDQQTERQMT